MLDILALVNRYKVFSEIFSFLWNMVKQGHVRKNLLDLLFGTKNFPKIM